MRLDRGGVDGIDWGENMNPGRLIDENDECTILQAIPIFGLL